MELEPWPCKSLSSASVGVDHWKPKVSSSSIFLWIFSELSFCLCRIYPQELWIGVVLFFYFKTWLLWWLWRLPLLIVYSQPHSEAYHPPILFKPFCLCSLLSFAAFLCTCSYLTHSPKTSNQNFTRVKHRLCFLVNTSVFKTLICRLQIPVLCQILNSFCWIQRNAPAISGL